MSLLTKERQLLVELPFFLRASCRIRTNDPEITNHVLWPTELKRRVGKRSASRRYNQLPLLRSSPVGFEGSWPYRTFPCQLYVARVCVSSGESEIRTREPLLTVTRFPDAYYPLCNGLSNNDLLIRAIHICGAFAVFEVLPLFTHNTYKNMVQRTFVVKNT